MHELALMRSLVDTVEARLPSERVRVVRLEVGRLSCALPDALRFCFDLCAQGTVLEGADLEILEIAGRASCRSCGREGPIEPPVPLCACGSADLDILAGSELRLKEVEVL